jgi:2'-5' RNA ligase
MPSLFSKPEKWSIETRKWMNPSRQWGREDGPAEDWVKPHVLWLPQQEPQVLGYFDRLREVVTQYPGVIAPIATEDLHMTIQSVRQHNTDGDRVDDEQLARAAAAVQSELDDVEPFDIEIGPARASGAAGIVEVWPETGLAALTRRVRAGLLAAGLVLPPVEEHFWPHISCGYGAQDSATAELAAQSDEFASAIGKCVRPGVRPTATIKSLWLVWEKQVLSRNTYTFERMHNLRLGPQPPRSPDRMEARHPRPCTSKPIVNPRANSEGPQADLPISTPNPTTRMRDNSK